MRFTQLCHSHFAFQIPITVHWLKQDGRLPERAYVERGTLTITNIQKGDSGVYVCRAESDDDVVEQHVTITVGGMNQCFPFHCNSSIFITHQLLTNTFCSYIFRILLAERPKSVLCGI